MISSFGDIYKQLQAVKPRSILFAGLFFEKQFKVLESCRQKKLLAAGVLLGNKKKINSLLATSGEDFSNFDVIDCQDDIQIMEKAITFFLARQIDILIKGSVNTAVFMKGILRQGEIVKKKNLVSDCMIYEVPLLNKIIAITDPSININPSLNDKIKIIENAISFYSVLFDIERPKVAVLSYTESLSDRDQNCIDAAFLSCLARRNKIHADIDGPLSLDLALIKEAVMDKGMKDNTVAGNADIILVPNLLVGNALAKSLSFLTDYNSGGNLLGVEKAIVLTSRAAKIEEKVNSIAVASLYSHKKALANRTRGDDH